MTDNIKVKSRKLFTNKDLESEDDSAKRLRAREILERLQKRFPNAKIALKYNNSIQLLVAVILSAQCTDKKVNEVTNSLFRKYKTARDFASASLAVFEREIHSTGFFRAKARNIIAACKTIDSRFKGKLPKTMAEMLTLPGIARKSANVILGNAYGVVEGIAVDTHVIRISQRLGLTKFSDPVKIERDLIELIPQNKWFGATYKIIEHGRNICDAKKPKCSLCPLKDICPSAFNLSNWE